MSWDNTIRKCDNCWGEVRLYFGDYITSEYEGSYYLEGECEECDRIFSREEYNELYLFRELWGGNTEDYYILKTPLDIICSRCGYDTGHAFLALHKSDIHITIPCMNCFEKDETIHWEKIRYDPEKHPIKKKIRIYYEGEWEWWYNKRINK